MESIIVAVLAFTSGYLLKSARTDKPITTEIKAVFEQVTGQNRIKPLKKKEPKTIDEERINKLEK